MFAISPAYSSIGRVRLQEWLNFISTELHKTFGPLFWPDFPDQAKAILRDRLKQRLAFAAEGVVGKTYLLGDQFSVADAYLFTVLGWCSYVGIDLGAWPALVAYRERVGSRPAVKAAMVAEGLAKQ